VIQSVRNQRATPPNPPFPPNCRPRQAVRSGGGFRVQLDESLTVRFPAEVTGYQSLIRYGGQGDAPLGLPPPLGERGGHPHKFHKNETGIISLKQKNGIMKVPRIRAFMGLGVAGAGS